VIEITSRLLLEWEAGVVMGSAMTSVTRNVTVKNTVASKTVMLIDFL